MKFSKTLLHLRYDNKLMWYANGLVDQGTLDQVMGGFLTDLMLTCDQQDPEE